MLYYAQCGVAHSLGHLSRVYLYRFKASVTCTSYTYFPLPHSQRESESGLTNQVWLRRLVIDHDISLLLCAFTVCYSTVDTSFEDIAMAESSKLSLQHVTTALYPLSIEQMKELVVYFGVELRVISDIETTHKENIKMYSIQAWLDQDTEASWEKIVSGLNQIGMNVLARQVATQHCPQSLVPGTPSPVATTPPVTDCGQSPPHTTSSTPTTVSDQSNPPASDHSQALALLPPTPHTSFSPTALALALPSTTNQASTVSFWSVDKVMSTIRQLKDMFLDLTTDAEEEIGQQDGPDKRFLRRFRKFIQLLPVARKPPHDRFFRQCRNEIVAAQNTDTLLAILCGYVDYRNYEIMLHIITGFCTAPLQESMHKYRVSLETFEMHTAVDVYISAVPDEMNEELKRGFSQMVLKIKKTASQCTLHEVRKLNEAIITTSGLESHSVYIGSVAKNCVMVSVRFPSSAVGCVLSAMTPNFMTTHCLSEVTLDGQQLTLEQREREKLVCGTKYCVICSWVYIHVPYNVEHSKQRTASLHPCILVQAFIMV